MFNVQILRRNTPQLARRWAAAVVAAGGGFENNSLSIASNLAQVLQTKSYYRKIRYLLPFLGKGINAARVPLIDTGNVGAATNTNFVDGDFTQATGLQGNGSSKIFNLNIAPDTVATGIGYWENNINFGGTDSGAMGVGVSGPDRRWYLDLRASLRIFSWGTFAERAEAGGAATNGLFYGQSTSATERFLFFNGTQLASDTTSDSQTSGAISLRLMGWEYDAVLYYWAGRCAVSFVTNGQLSAAEISDFQTTLQSYLMTPTGRPSS